MGEESALNALGWLISSVLPFIIVISIVVFVHELGHYLVARWAGIHSDVFSVGFGRELAGFTDRRGTRWRIGAIPIGGYVRFRGDADATSLSHQSKPVPGAFFSASPLARMLAVVAGPAANLLLAIVLFSGVVYFQGRPSSEPIIGGLTSSVEDDTEAALQRLGLRVGDLVVNVDGKQTPDFYTLSKELAESAGRQISLLVIRDGREVDLTLRISDSTIIDRVRPRSAADKAGFRRGDAIIAVDGTEIETFSQLRQRVLNSGGRALEIRFVRDGSIMNVLADPQPVILDGKTTYILGVTHRPDYALLPQTLPVSLPESLWLGAKSCWFIVSRIGELLGSVFQGSDEAVDSLGGPILIAQEAKAASQYGVVEFLLFIAQISISIGLLNLLPIPALDGGHLVFITYELIRRRKLSESWQMIASGIGISLLLMLMIFAFYNDLSNM